MGIKGRLREEVEKLAREIDCPKDFSCCKSDFCSVGSVRDHGDEKFLECLEKNGGQCSFSLCFEGECFCLCPIRIHAANMWKI